MRMLRRLYLGVTALALANSPTYAQPPVLPPPAPNPISGMPTPLSVTTTTKYTYTPEGVQQVADEGRPAKVTAATEIRRVGGSQVVATPGCCTDACCDPCCDTKMHFDLFGDFLYLTTRNVDVAYAQPRNGVVPTAPPVGPLSIASPGYSPGFRIGGGWSCDERSAFVGTFGWLDNSTTVSDSTGTPNVMTALLTLPATANAAAGATTASSIYGIQFRTADIDYKRIISSDCNYSVNWLAGVRYAHLGQDLNTTYAILGTTQVSSSVDFDGGGPRVGVEGEFVAKNGIMAYGRGVGNLMVGHFNADYTQTNRFAGIQGWTTYTDDRVVPILETELGVGWVAPRGHVRWTIGYMVNAWFNAVITPDLVKGVQNTNFTTNGDNLTNSLTFDGFVTRVELRF